MTNHHERHRTSMCTCMYYRYYFYYLYFILIFVCDSVTLTRFLGIYLQYSMFPYKHRIVPGTCPATRLKRVLFCHRMLRLPLNFVSSRVFDARIQIMKFCNNCDNEHCFLVVLISDREGSTQSSSPTNPAGLRFGTPRIDRTAERGH